MSHHGLRDCHIVVHLPVMHLELESHEVWQNRCRARLGFDGGCTFASFGPDDGEAMRDLSVLLSMVSLRESWRRADDEEEVGVFGGLTARCWDLIDMSALVVKKVGIERHLPFHAERDRSPAVSFIAAAV